MVKKVAIIGAGASGLTALKISHAEYGMDAWCFEKSPDLGGLWRYKPNNDRPDSAGEASVMRSTIMNTSKEMMAFSDFPPPAEFPNFMPHRNVLEYFRSYANHFGIFNRIRFNTEIVSVQRAQDYQKTGQWVVTVKNSQTGEIKSHVFDAVFACTGHHVDPYVPKFKGLEPNGSFKGRVLHSVSYKDPSGYEDKRVVVVGAGNSAADIAVELSRVADKVYLVTRRGTWVQHRVFDNGYPLDISVTTRYNTAFANYFPNLAIALAQHKVNFRFDHEKYGLMPKNNIFQQAATVNDELPGRIFCGTVLVKPGIKEFQSNNAVVFEDGSKVENIDAVVMCTGYSFGFPFLEKGNLIPVNDNWVNLYKYMYAPHLAHPETLAIIGCCQVTGALMPLCEMQSRVACEFLKDNPTISFPTRSEMEEDIEKKADDIRQRFVDSRRHTIHVDYINYMDELSSIIGARPSIAKYLASDPRLAASMFFGPCLPYQYRLQGPHAWPKARRTILSTWDRVWRPYKKLGSPEMQVENVRPVIPKFRFGFGRLVGRSVASTIVALLIFGTRK